MREQCFAVYPFSAVSVPIVQKSHLIPTRPREEDASLPLSRHLHFSTSDIDEACERVGKVFCQHTINYTGRGRKLSFLQTLAALDRITYSYVTYGEAVTIDAGEPERWFMVHTAQGGPCSTMIGRNEVAVSPGLTAISSPTLHLRMRWTPECGQFVTKIERAALVQQLSHLLHDEVREPIEFLLDPDALSDVSAEYHRILQFASKEIEQGDSFFRSRIGKKQLEETVMNLLLMRFPHNYSDRLLAPAQTIAPRSVRLAEEYMRNHADSDISVADLTAMTGTSARSLYDSFRRFRQTTPMEFLRKCRLESARKDLLDSNNSETIADIAIKWGFNNLGRFSGLYRQRYGELPSETRRYKK
ncbi:MAG: AraC family transcriptional regulator [Pararhodobacter sp.]|nr:AraC family transcriptional regulator [Pararhodobacter sp.]